MTASFRVFKTDTLPSVLMANAIYMLPSTTDGYLDIYVSNQTGTAAKRTPSLEDFRLLTSIAGIFRVDVKTVTADYTLTAADSNGKTMIQGNSGTLININVPADSTTMFEIGTSIMLVQADVGQIQIVPSVGVTIATPETLRTRKKDGCVTLIKIAANSWRVEGNLETL